MMYGFGDFGGGFMIIFWIFIIWMIFIILKGGRNGCGFNPFGNHHEQKGNDPVNILKERYAKGEIDKNQFIEMKKDLEK